MLSGLEMAEVQQLEEFLTKSLRLKLASGLWSRYMRGEVLPQGALLPGASSSLVHRIAKAAPKTLDTFYTPVWDMLEWKSVVDIEQIRSIYLQMGEDVYVHFVARIEDGDARVPAACGKFWHLVASFLARRPILMALGDWTRLIVCLLEARMAYAAQKHSTFAQYQLMACETISHLHEIPQFRAKRLQGVLLQMEALCIDALVVNVIHSPPVSVVQAKTREDCIAWLRKWHLRTDISSVPTLSHWIIVS